MNESLDNFEGVLEELESRRSDFTIHSSNWLEGQALLSAIKDVEDTCRVFADCDEGTIDDSLWFHVFYFAIVPDYMRACFLLIDHELYRLSRMHHRYLFELWLLLKGLNHDPEMAVEIFEELSDEDSDGRDWVGERPAVTADEFGSIAKDQRQDVPEEWVDLMWNHPSWEVVHPLSIKSLWADEGYDTGWEKRYLNATLTLVFLISSQVMIGFEGTELEDEVREELEPLFKRAKMVSPGVPRVPEEDLRYW